MLVLTRKIEETVLIEGQIEIQVLKIKGNTVRIGIKAPSDVRIVRGELAPFGLTSGDQEFEIEFPDDQCESQVSISAEADNLIRIIAQAG